MVTLEGRCEAVSLIFGASRDSPNLSCQKGTHMLSQKRMESLRDSPVWWMPQIWVCGLIVVWFVSIVFYVRVHTRVWILSNIWIWVSGVIDAIGFVLAAMYVSVLHCVPLCTCSEWVDPSFIDAVFSYVQTK